MTLLRFIANTFLARREPFSIVHFLTDRCNARCRHCFMDFQRPLPPQDLLSLQEIEQVTATLGRCLYNVNLTGGEPFLREDLFDIVAAYFRNSTARSIVITTNGTLVDAVRLFLDRCGRASFDGRIKLSISMDGFEVYHDDNRNLPGAFRRALETYRLVEARRDSRIMADIALTVTPSNRRDVLRFHAYLREMGVQHISPILMRTEGVVTSIDQHPEVVQAYRQLASRVCSDRAAGNQYPSAHAFPEAVRSAKNTLVGDIFTRTGRGEHPVTVCTAGRLFGVISPNGDVFPCEPLDLSWRMGNVRASDLNFMRLWRGGPAASVRSRLRDARCSCTYECAWTVNVLADPALLPRMALHTWSNLRWNRQA